MRAAWAVPLCVLGLGCKPPGMFKIGEGFEPQRHPRIAARLLGPHRAVVEGKDLPAAVRLLVEIDVDVPHASVACRDAFSRTVETSADGRFRVDIEPPADSGCTFTCDGERSPLRAWVGEDLRSERFRCW